MSMQCLSSTNEAFLSQKIDLIAELKMSKDINGIRKLKVEKAKMEGSYGKEAFVDVTKQFTTVHFVETVSTSADFSMFLEFETYVIFAKIRFPKETMQVMLFQTGNAKC